MVGVGLVVLSAVLLLGGWSLVQHYNITAQFSSSEAAGTLLGNVTSMSYANGKLSLSGWVCQKNLSVPITVSIYRGDRAEQLGEATNGQSSPAYVAQKCGTQGNYGFSFSQSIPAADFNPNIYVYVNKVKIYPQSDSTSLLSPDGKQQITFYKPWGGVPIFFGLTNQPKSNVLDDTLQGRIGRQLQSAVRTVSKFKEGCAWNNTCKGSEKVPNACMGNDQYSGYNPTQGGQMDLTHGSPASVIIRKDSSGNAIGAYTITRALLWGSAWNGKYPQCPVGTNSVLSNIIFVDYYQFIPVGNTYVLKMNVAAYNYENFRVDFAKEMPILFVGNGKPDYFSGAPQNAYTRLFNSDGKEISNFVPGSDPNNLRADFNSSYRWAIFQDSALDYGVGIYFASGSQQLTAIHSHTSSDDAYSIMNQNNISIAPGGSSASSVAYLALGNLSTVRNILSAVSGGGKVPTPSPVVSPSLTPAPTLSINPTHLPLPSIRIIRRYGCFKNSCVPMAYGPYANSSCNNACSISPSIAPSIPVIYPTPSRINFPTPTPTATASVTRYGCSGSACVMMQYGPYTTPDCGNTCGISLSCVVDNVTPSTSGTAPFQVTFWVTLSGNASGAITWDYGDGRGPGQIGMTHTYSSAGSYLPVATFYESGTGRTTSCSGPIIQVH